MHMQKGFHFLTTLKNNDKFEWAEECKESFAKLKIFLETPLIMISQRKEKSLYLYLSVIDNNMSCLMVQALDGLRDNLICEKGIQGDGPKYQKIEILVITIVTTVRNLRSYF